MPNDTSDETQAAMTYPTKEQYENWKEHADELDMSVSQFMQHMVAAGRKKFEATVDPDQTNQELRKQRNDLKDENDRLRSRISELEDDLYHSERRVIERHIEENPGSDYHEILQYLSDSKRDRLTRHLDSLEGKSIRRAADDCYYPVESEEDQ